VVTLYVAIAIEAIASGTAQKKIELNVEHWIFLAVSCAGLLATLRALSSTQVHPWQTGLSVAGLAATILLIAENLVRRRAKKKWAMLWSTVFIFVVLVILIL
jgi:hypothetical protein